MADLSSSTVVKYTANDIANHTANHIADFTLVDLLNAAAKEDSAGRGYTFIDGPIDGARTVHIPFGELRLKAIETAGVLQQMGVERGNTVLITLPTGPDFARIYWALQLCGAVPCVLPPSGSGGSDSQSARRIVQVGQQTGARLLIVTPQDADAWADGYHPFRVVTSTELLHPPAGAGDRAAIWSPVPVSPDDVALIQATSGSTESPKCVVLTHRNVVANLDQIGQRLGVHAGDVVCSWLPLFHDMGLVGCFLFTMRWRIHGVMMMPYRFLRRPVDWLRAISHYDGTLSPAPNFAYALATERVQASDLAELDLSTWRSAMCGAEPIDVRVLQRFAERFAPCGFQPSALTPCYGMAEAALAVTIQPPGQSLYMETVSRSQLVAGQPVETLPNDAGASAPTGADRLQVCACGPAMPGTRIEIRAADGIVLPAGYLGEIWIATPSLMQGYHGQGRKTSAVLQEGWFNTGDVGYLRHGQLYVTGRAKELIIIRGHNYLPTDVEWAAAELDDVAPGRVAAFGAYDPASGTDQLVVVCEEPRRFRGQLDDLVESIRAHIGKRTGLLPAQVRMVPRNSIPHTTSGKLQRTLVKRLYEEHWSQTDDVDVSLLQLA